VDTDPDPDDNSYIVDFAYLMQDESGQVRCEYDRHVFDCSTSTWLRLMAEAGFSAGQWCSRHSESNQIVRDVYWGALTGRPSVTPDLDI
jgi:hypothetical protein